MMYLFLAIVCSASIAFIFKFAEKRNMNPYVISSSNYFIASALSLMMILSKDLLSKIIKNSSFFEEWHLVLEGSRQFLGPFNSIVWGMIVGGISGFFFFYSFLYYQKSVKDNGVSLSGTFSKMGILIPMIFSIVIWKEFPSPIQWIGILLSLGSIIIVNLSFDSIQKFNFNKTLVFLFLFGGFAEFSNKIYQKYALTAFKDVFLFSVFFVAFIISFIYVKKRKEQWHLKEILTGFLVGVPNLFSSYFLILSLDTLSTSIAFPIYSAASIVLINIGGLFFFKEKISTKNKFAIILVVIALILINI